MRLPALRRPGRDDRGSRRDRPDHRPALDGVRALAVIAVLLYHGLVSWSTGGFLGVDVFFVLSGYLITTLLLTEHSRWGSIDLVGFYLRRARRLLPALVLVVLAVAGWAATEAQPERLGAIRADGLSSLLYVANWRFIVADVSYFDQYGDPSPFRHMWSLAIEEQYYLLFPLLLLGLLSVARSRTRTLLVALGLLTVLSIVEMALLHDPAGDASRVYYGTDTRIHELLIGCLLAAVLSSERFRSGPVRERAAQAAPYLGAVGLVGVLAAFSFLTDQSTGLYRGGFALVCLAAAALVAGIELAPRSPVARLLALPPVAWVGVISYGLYLWHWPLYVVLTPDRTGLDGTPLLLVRIGVTFVVSALSYYLVEKPIRSGTLKRLPLGAGRVLTYAAIPTTLAVLVAGTAGAVGPQLPSSPFGPAAVASGQRSLLVVGDSVGYSLSQAFPRAQYSDWKVQEVTRLGCGITEQTLAINGVRGGPAKPECRTQLESWSAAVENARPESVVLSLGSWEVFDHVIEDKILSPGDPEYDSHLRNALTEAHEILTRTGARLYLTDVPCYGEESVAVAGRNGAQVRNDPARAAAVNAVLEEFVASNPRDTALLGLGAYLCPDGRYSPRIGNVEMRYDGVHFTDAGGALVWKDVIMPALGGSTSTLAMLVGDSVPYGLYERFPASEYPDLRLFPQTQLGCSAFAAPSVLEGVRQPQDAVCSTWAGALPARIDKQQPDVGLVFVGIGEQFDKLVDGEVLPFGSPEHTAWLRAQLVSRVSLFVERDIPVLLPTVPCHQKDDFGVDDVAEVVNDDERVRQVNEVVEDVADSFADGGGPDVEVVDLYDSLCADGYTNEIDGAVLREDGVHFTTDGAAYVWSILQPAIDAVVEKTAG